MSRQLMVGLSVLFLFGGAAVVAVAIALQRRSSRAYIHRTAVNSRPVGSVYLKVYPVISRNILSKHAVASIRSRMEIVGNSNERTIRKKTVQIYGAILVLQLVLLATITLVTGQLLMILLFIAVLWFLSETLVDFFVIRQKNRLMKQQIKFNDLIRHKYYETGMVDEAIYQACQSLDRHHFEVGLQGQRIHDILMARDVEKEMVTYNETAPNKFLKMLLGLAYITMEYGDSKVDGASVFMRNLGDLTGEIRIELTKREKLNYALKSLNIIVLLPLFFISPIRQWAGSYFVQLEAFYESRTGFFLEIFTVVMIFVCYILLRRVQQFEDSRLSYRKDPPEQRLYEKFLHPLIDRIKPGPVRYYRIRRRLKGSASRLSVEAFVTRQAMAFVIGLAFAIGMFTAMHYNQRHHVLTAPTFPDTFVGGEIDDEDLLRAEAVTEADTMYLSQMTSVTSREEIMVMLADKGLPAEEVELVALRLMDKQAIFFNQYFKWWELVLCLAAAGLMTRLPMIYLGFQQRILRIELEDEVAGFASIILMLMHHQRTSVTDVLEWMEIYANAFKEPISDCINNAASGLTEALEALRESSDNERFVNIADSLILASQDISLREAFEELSTEKTFYTEERKESNNRIVERKINLGQMVGFMPLYGLIVVYMIIPMIVVATGEMKQYFNQLQF